MYESASERPWGLRLTPFETERYRGRLFTRTLRSVYETQAIVTRLPRAAWAKFVESSCQGIGQLYFAPFTYIYHLLFIHHLLFLQPTRQLFTLKQLAKKTI